MLKTSELKRDQSKKDPIYFCFHEHYCSRKIPRDQLHQIQATPANEDSNVLSQLQGRLFTLCTTTKPLAVNIRVNNNEPETNDFIICASTITDLSCTQPLPCLKLAATYCLRTKTLRTKLFLL